MASLGAGALPSARLHTPRPPAWHRAAAETSAKGQGVMEDGIVLTAEKSPQLAWGEGDKPCTLGRSHGRRLGLWWEGKAHHHCHPQQRPGAMSLGNGHLNSYGDYFPP